MTQTSHKHSDDRSSSTDSNVPAFRLVGRADSTILTLRPLRPNWLTAERANCMGGNLKGSPTQPMPLSQGRSVHERLHEPQAAGAHTHLAYSPAVSWGAACLSNVTKMLASHILLYISSVLSQRRTAQCPLRPHSLPCLLILQRPNQPPSTLAHSTDFRVSILPFF